MREYFRHRPTGDYEWWDAPNLDSTTRTVHEVDETFDTGILDEAGNKIMAREKKDPIGFVRFKGHR